MKKSLIFIATLAAMLLSGAGASAADATDCVSAAPLALRVRIGMAPPLQALLVGGTDPALRIVDPRTDTTLWSAGSGTATTQRFTAMTATFSGSFIALDTDRDGLHDRIYAGDHAGRLWRFDLHNGAPTDAFASGGVFADFGNAVGRGFRAPPDVSLATTAGAAPWFNIALGTASPGRSDASNRFYVLRDSAPFQSWSDAQYHDWPPLRETDLLHVTTLDEPARTDIHSGWFIELHGGDVLTASLTVAGRTVFAIADIPATGLDGCRATFSIASVDLAQARLLADAVGEWRIPLAGGQALDAVFTLTAGATRADATRALCTFGAARVSGCDIDLRPRRTWWRRDDAE